MLKYIPVKELDKIYLARARSIVVETAKGQEIPLKLIELIKKILNASLKSASTAFIPVEGYLHFVAKL